MLFNKRQLLGRTFLWGFFCGVFHVQTFIDHRRQFSLVHLGRIRADTVAEAIIAARSLVATMKLGEQYKMLLPAILLRIKPVVTQERAELESDYDLIATKVGDLYTPYYNEMLEQAATVYAANFTVDEMRQMEAFFRQPTGQKLIENGRRLRSKLRRSVRTSAARPPRSCGSA